MTETEKELGKMEDWMRGVYVTGLSEINYRARISVMTKALEKEKKRADGALDQNERIADMRIEDCQRADAVKASAKQKDLDLAAIRDAHSKVCKRLRMWEKDGPAAMEAQDRLEAIIDKLNMDLARKDAALRYIITTLEPAEEDWMRSMRTHAEVALAPSPTKEKKK